MMTSCQSADKPSDSKESLTPVEASDKQRYNINEADKAVIQLDSAARDSTLRDTLKN